ncbi:MAG: hypothetical protein H0Z34_07900 [Brevibacillus sp.]|nr:hypothetical protein [Brevibacillus sp.]
MRQSEPSRSFDSLFLDRSEVSGIVVDLAIWRTICQSVPKTYTIPDPLFVKVLLETDE